jgi:LemA protein
VTPVEWAAAFAVGVLVAVVGYLAFATYNAVVALRYRIDKAWSNIDVVLKQRFDQLPNLVEAVRGLMAWEQAVLVEVTEARAAYSPTAPIPDQAATSAATTSAIRSLFATVERYPDVRSAANVMALQEEIERLEAMIADRRELYNDQVYRYNTRIAQVPAVLLATLLGWRARPFFTASDAERARPAAGLGTAETEAETQPEAEVRRG